MTGEPERKYIVASLHGWNEAVYNDHVRQLPGVWEYVSSRETLESALDGSATPRYVFFPHWSHKVPDRIINRFECIAFHMTDVPYGRGGSPLQNLIVRGHTSTKLTALRMTSELDAGPVYLKKPLSLEGSAHEIFGRAAGLAAKMIKQIVESNIVPVEQVGTPTIFKRRTPLESEMPTDLDALSVYNFIRMLDAPGYPRAFMKRAGYRLEFSDAELHEDRVEAKIIFELEKDTE